MEEAEALAGRVGIIDHGELIIEGSPEELVNEMGADVIHLSGQGNQSAFLDDVKSLDYVQRLHTSNGTLQIGLDHGNHRLAELVSLANKNQYLIQDIRIARPSLGDVFLKYTGRRLRDE